MALKGDRHELDTDISFFMTEVEERGVFVALSGAGSGAAMDNSAAVAYTPTNPSGQYALGILLNDIVNLDLTRQHLNQHKDEVQLGSKVTIGRKGYWVTDQVYGTVTAGADAYLHSGGQVSSTQLTGAPKVGQFLSTKNSEGYAKVAVNL
jgi:hypothetical protein